MGLSPLSISITVYVLYQFSLSLFFSSSRLLFFSSSLLFFSSSLLLFFSSSLLLFFSSSQSFLLQFWKFLCLFCCKFPEFFKTPLTFFIGMVLKGVMDKNPQKSKIRKYAILSQPTNLTFFEDEIFQLFSFLYGSKVAKCEG